MNDNERGLIRAVCESNMKDARAYAQIILKSITTEKDKKFKENYLRRLEAKGDMIELPYNLKELLAAEDETIFPKERYLFRENELNVITKAHNAYLTAEKLKNMGIEYLPAVMLYGESGCGKTLLAKYLAHICDLPYIYVRFSSIVSSYLGSTQSNIAKIFAYAKENPCVLCFDEIDAVGMCRGRANDVGEMNRVVIALMQELDQLPNNVIIVGTTNRFDRLDPALIRRFPIKAEIKPFSGEEAITAAKKFFAYAGISDDQWCEDTFYDWRVYTAAEVNRICTEEIVKRVEKNLCKE